MLNLPPDRDEHCSDKEHTATLQLHHFCMGARQQASGSFKSLSLNLNVRLSTLRRLWGVFIWFWALWPMIHVLLAGVTAGCFVT